MKFDQNSLNVFSCCAVYLLLMQPLTLGRYNMMCRLFGDYSFQSLLNTEFQRCLFHDRMPFFQRNIFEKRDEEKDHFTSKTKNALFSIQKRLFSRTIFFLVDFDTQYMNQCTT